MSAQTAVHHRVYLVFDPWWELRHRSTPCISACMCFSISCWDLGFRGRGLTTKAPNHPVVPGAARWSQSPVEAATLRHRAHWSQRYHHHNRRRTHLYTLQSTSTPLVHFPFDDQPTCTPPIRRTTSQAVGRQTAGGAEAWPAHTARSPALGTRARYVPLAVSSRA